MSSRSKTPLALIAVVAVALLGGYTAHRVRGSSERARAAAAVARPAGTGALAAPLRRVGSDGASARVRLSGVTVERRFVTSYLRFLQGRGHGASLPYTTITARDDAAGGGRMPAGLSDGPLKLRSLDQNGATAHSAHATVVAADREVSFAFTVLLIREADGWWVSDVQPPDFDVARASAGPRRWPGVPAAARHATVAFARSYLAHLKGGRLGAVTATARAETRAGEDSLHRLRLPRAAAVRVVGLQYGPFEHDRFAVTVSAVAAGRRLTFTVLMLRTRRGWECDAFL